MSGVSVIIPTAGDRRLPLLAATVAGLRRRPGIGQVVLAETGPRCCAGEIARRWDCDHVHAPDPGPFNRARALNLGSSLARGEALLWCDGDVLFDDDFLPRALAELAERRLDFLLPFSVVHGLGEAETARVLAGRRAAADCMPAVSYGPPHPGTIGLVRTGFLRRHGGMIEDFRGWGYEDNAWAHKVALLGRIGWTRRDDQRIWHLFHPQRTRDLSKVEENRALYRDMMAIDDATTFGRLFPPSRPPAPPWDRATRVLFATAMADDPAGVALARRWAADLHRRYGVRLPIMRAAAAASDEADMIVLFGDGPAAEASAARLHDRPCIRVTLSTDAAPPPPRLSGAAHWLLARTASQADRWRVAGDRVWHRPWQIGGAAAGEEESEAAPVLVQVLSRALAAAKPWSVRIAIDRALLPAAACYRSPFWYVALHDADGNAIARDDADGRELLRLLTPAAETIVLHRTILSPRPPAAWTIWPVDRHRRWLDRLAGPVAGATVAAA